MRASSVTMVVLGALSSLPVLALGCTAATRARPAAQNPNDLTWTGDDPGWMAGFADHPPGVEKEWHFEADQRRTPPGFAGQSKALFITGDNHSDDLFMFWKRRITGLVPRAAYKASIEVSFLTDAPKGCLGAGGSPGESVWVKSGLPNEEPRSVVAQDGNVRMNIDKGEQSQPGPDAIVLGNVAGTNTNCKERRWERKELRTSAPLSVTTGPDGSLWLIVGTDSGFEARTSLYYERVSVRLDAAAPAAALTAKDSLPEMVVIANKNLTKPFLRLILPAEIRSATGEKIASVTDAFYCGASSGAAVVLAQLTRKGVDKFAPRLTAADCRAQLSDVVNAHLRDEGFDGALAIRATWSPWKVAVAATGCAAVPGAFSNAHLDWLKVFHTDTPTSQVPMGNGNAHEDYSLAVWFGADEVAVGGWI